MYILLTFNIVSTQVKIQTIDHSGKDIVRTLAQLIEIIYMSHLARVSSVGCYYREAGWVACLSMHYNLVSDLFLRSEISVILELIFLGLVRP